MIKDKLISLTTDELAVVLVLCGYEVLANQILLNEEKLQSEEMIDYFASNIEDSLKLKGFWNDERDTLIEEKLEGIIRLLVLSKKKVRFITGNKVTFLHKLINEKFLLQIIENGVHTFEYLEEEYNIKDMVKRIVKNIETEKSLNSWQPLLFDSETFDEFHNRSSEELLKLSSNEVTGIELKCFIKDFIENNQEFDNVSCMIMDSKEDVMQIVDVLFYLSGAKNIWFVNYDQVEEEKILIISDTYIKFTEDVSDWLTSFFRI